MRALFCLFFSMACAGTDVTPPNYVPGIVSAEYQSSVRLTVACVEGIKMGSGTAISRKHILTARHVVDCQIGGPVVILALDHEQNEYKMVIDKLSDQQDIARIVTADKKDTFKTYARTSFGIYPVGTHVCLVTGDGSIFMIRKCGEIGIATDTKYYLISVRVVPGNSGSGLWLADGSIAGVVTRGKWIAEDENIGLAVPSEAFRMEMYNDIYYVDGTF